MAASRRVVVTGCGVVCAAGSELPVFWDAVLQGRCFVGPLQGFSCPGLDDLRGAEAVLPPEDELPRGVDDDPERARCAALALAAARRAVADAGLARGSRELDGAGVVVGTTLGEERQAGDLALRGRAAAAGFLTRGENHRLAALIAREHRLHGPVMVNATACSSGNAATAWAFDLVASGDVDVMLAGGADTFTRVVYTGFSRMGALSKSVCRPFDEGRDGVSFGEGAGVLVLEDLEHARRRGANIYAELAGYGVSNDAHHVTAPEPHGEGVVRAVRQALASTGTEAARIDYVSAHGTGTPQNEAAEVAALRALFGERLPHVPVSSLKSMIGHTNGAASAIESVACALAIRHQQVPPTANLVHLDPAFAALDVVPGRGRPARVSTCLNLSSGFGGSNACVILREVQ